MTGARRPDTATALGLPDRGTGPDPYGLTPVHWGNLRTAAHLAGWAARAAAGFGQAPSTVRPDQTDTIVDAALRAVAQRLHAWHEQDPRRHPATRTLPLPRGDGDDGDAVRVTLQVVVDLPVDSTPERTVEIADERVHAALEEGVGLDLVDVTVTRADGP